MNRIHIATLAGAAALLLTPAALLAQTAPTTAPPPAKHSMLSNMMARMHAMRSGHSMTATNQHINPAAPANGSFLAPMQPPFIGDKKTHVFHLPGSAGTLPALQNRVYFRSAAQAEAAGYHQAGLPGGHGMAKAPATSRHRTNFGTGHAGASGVKPTATQLHGTGSR